MMTTVFDLPDELFISHIAPYLSKRDRNKFSASCKLWSKSILPHVRKFMLTNSTWMRFKKDQRYRELVLSLFYDISVFKENVTRNSKMIIVPKIDIIINDFKTIGNFYDQNFEDEDFDVDKNLQFIEDHADYISSITTLPLQDNKEKIETSLHTIFHLHENAIRIPKNHEIRLPSDQLFVLEKVQVNDKNEILVNHSFFNKSTEGNDEITANEAKFPLFSAQKGIDNINLKSEGDSHFFSLTPRYNCTLNTLHCSSCPILFECSSLRGIPNIFILHCDNLVSIDDLVNAKSVGIMNCKNLKNLPNLQQVPQVYLDSVGATDYSRLGFVQSLTIRSCDIEHYPYPQRENQVWSFYKVNIKNVKIFENLQSLSLERCNFVTDISCLSNILMLEINWCENIHKYPVASGQSQHWIFRHQLSLEDVSIFSKVRQLELQSCQSVKDVSSLANVRILSLSYLPIVDVSALKDVEELYLFGCYKVISIQGLSNVYGRGVPYHLMAEEAKFFFSKNKS